MDLIVRHFHNFNKEANMNIEEAREYLVKQHKPEFKNYILFHLAGDCAVEIAEQHERLTLQLEKELKYIRDNSND